MAFPYDIFVFARGRLAAEPAPEQGEKRASRRSGVHRMRNAHWLFVTSGKKPAGGRHSFKLVEARFLKRRPHFGGFGRWTELLACRGRLFAF